MHNAYQTQGIMTGKVNIDFKAKSWESCARCNECSQRSWYRNIGYIGILIRHWLHKTRPYLLILVSLFIYCFVFCLFVAFILRLFQWDYLYVLNFFFQGLIYGTSFNLYKNFPKVKCMSTVLKKKNGNNFWHFFFFFLLF